MGNVVNQAKVSQNASKGTPTAGGSASPGGNHGDNGITMPDPKTPTPVERNRLSVDFSPVVSSHLDHISEVTGVSKAGIVSGALLEALPALLARADALKKRHQELGQSRKK